MLALLALLLGERHSPFGQHSVDYEIMRNAYGQTLPAVHFVG